MISRRSTRPFDAAPRTQSAACPRTRPQTREKLGGLRRRPSSLALDVEPERQVRLRYPRGVFLFSLRSSPLAHPSPPHPRLPSTFSSSVEMAASTPAWAWDLLGMVLFPCSASTSSCGHRSTPSRAGDPVSSPTPTARSPSRWTLPFLGIFIPLAIILLVAHPRERPRDPPRRRRPVPRRHPRVRRDQLHQKRRRRLDPISSRDVGPTARSPGRHTASQTAAHAPSRRDGRPKIIPQRPRLHVLLRLSYASAYAAARLGVFSRRRAGTRSRRRRGARRLRGRLALAAAVSISRTQDYWHHLEDVA